MQKNVKLFPCFPQNQSFNNLYAQKKLYFKHIFKPLYSIILILCVYTQGRKVQICMHLVIINVQNTNGTNDQTFRAERCKWAILGNSDHGWLRHRTRSAYNCNFKLTRSLQIEFKTIDDTLTWPYSYVINGFLTGLLFSYKGRKYSSINKLRKTKGFFQIWLVVAEISAFN